MERVVLIGSNIAHSRSPRLHNRLFEQYELPYRYELAPMTTDAVVPALEMMKRGGYRGANITSPHKLAALPALDALSAEAGAIGAVNTIVFADGRALGHNTDAAGFIAPLIDHPLHATSFTAALFGTGGAAMAAVYALLALPSLRRLMIYSRDAGRAAEAAARWNDPRVEGDVYTARRSHDLLVNATPRDLADTGTLPVPIEALEGASLAYEMIYWPPVTPFLAAARKLGVETIGGAPMFIAQALASFRLWTGITPRVEDVSENMIYDER